MTVQRILDSQHESTAAHIAPDAEISDVLNSLAFKDVGALVVSSDGSKVEGIISERDIVRGLRTLGPDLLSKRVAEIDGARLDVVSDGPLIDTGQFVEVTRVDGNRIVVRRLPHSIAKE